MILVTQQSGNKKEIRSRGIGTRYTQTQDSSRKKYVPIGSCLVHDPHYIVTKYRLFYTKPPLQEGKYFIIENGLSQK